MAAQPPVDAVPWYAPGRPECKLEIRVTGPLAFCTFSSRGEQDVWPLGSSMVGNWFLHKEEGSWTVRCLFSHLLAGSDGCAWR